MTFELKHYRNTLIAFKEAGYEITLSCTDNLAGKDLQLIHDVDFDPRLSLNLAKIESDVGAISTYFFRLRAVHYNLFSADTSSIIDQLIMMGHNVGLHYENSKYNKTSEQDIVNSIDVMSKMMNHDVEFFNVHEPTRTGLDLRHFLPNKNRCYNSSFFDKYKYISDSGGRWREGCFSNFVNKHDKMLVLTHPLWWYENYPGENY